MSFGITGVTGSYPTADNRITSVVKLVDEDRQSDETITADSEVFLPLAINSRYYWFGVISTEGSTTADMDFTYTIPSGASGQWNRFNVGAGTATAYAAEITLIINGVRDWASYGTILTGSTAGNLTLAWAQTLSTAADTTMRQGSWLQLFKLA